MAPSRWTWIEGAILVLMLAALAAAWKWTALGEWADPDNLSDLLEPFRRSWLGLPLVIAVFVLLELVMFPVLVLIFVCGLAFGPWLGAAYALVGSVASAIPPFLLGRKLGRERIEHWGGEAARKLTEKVHDKGLIAVFVLRKIPAPYTAVNMACGASGLRLRDFVLGTALGMVSGIVLITVVGTSLTELFSDPEPGKLWLMAGVIAGAVTMALLLQRWVRRRTEAA
jgi:phospholipase D1/2